MILSTSYFCLSVNNIQNVSSKQLWVRKDYRSVRLLWTSIIGISYSWLWTLHQNCIISTNSILYLKSKSSSHHPPPLVKSCFNSFKPVRVWYIKSFEVTMTVCAEVILAGLILNDFKTALYHPGWKWLITNYLSVYSRHLYVTTSWAFFEVSFFTKVALIYPIAFHCAVWRWGGAWDSACLRVTDLHVVHHCMVWIQQLPMQGFTLVSCCIGKLGIFLTKSNQVATSLRVPPNPSCEKDVETHGLSPFPTKRKWIYKQALTNRLRSLQRILFRLLRWNRNLGLPIHTLVLYFF